MAQRRKVPRPKRNPYDWEKEIASFLEVSDEKTLETVKKKLGNSLPEKKPPPEIWPVSFSREQMEEVDGFIEYLKSVSELSIAMKKVTRSAAIRVLLNRGLQQWKREKAIDRAIMVPKVVETMIGTSRHKKIKDTINHAKIIEEIERESVIQEVTKKETPIRPPQSDKEELEKFLKDF